MMNSIDNPFSISGNNYLITGAASGIGKATSILLSKMDANLILVDINSEGLYETKSKCKSTDKILALDLSKPSLIKSAVINSVNEFGKLHGFIHLAGRPYISPLKTISEEKCAEVYTLNTYAAIELAKNFTNRNVFVGEKGSIVFVSSVYALVGSSANVGYAMSKAALHGITKSLAIELAPKNIRVNCIAPGFVKTKMMDDTGKLFSDDRNEVLENLHPLGLGDADDVGYACAFLLSDASKWITGSILNVDGGFTAK
jgi:NAD(P)-dependent dehydrogenase (short-subunit alcohol dehydrogenase family)